MKWEDINIKYTFPSFHLFIVQQLQKAKTATEILKETLNIFQKLNDSKDGRKGGEGNKTMDKTNRKQCNGKPANHINNYIK